MIQKKVCLLGAFAVGKTSLVRRFVSSLFDDRYLSTVGVKVDKKLITVGAEQLTLVIWDLAGEDGLHTVPVSYLRGAAGYLLVADGTRESTLATAGHIQRRVEEQLGPLPFLLVVNKADLGGEWEVGDAGLAALEASGWRTARTSAKTGAGVEEVFTALAGMLCGAR